MSELSESVIDSLRKYLMVRGRTADEIADALTSLTVDGYYEIRGQVSWGTPPEVKIPQSEEVVNVWSDVRGEGSTGEPTT